MEEWRDIPGYEGLYQICIDTPEGRCRSLNYKRTGRIKELSNAPNKRDGRITWCLWKDNQAQTYQAARWIAFTYPELIENEFFEGACIDHKDTNRLNNHPSNLHWVTKEDNSRNPITILHYKECNTGRKQSDETRHKKSKSLKGKLINRLDCSKKVMQILNGEVLNIYSSIMEAERLTGISNVSICAVCRGRHKSAGGFIWRYAEQA